MNDVRGKHPEPKITPVRPARQRRLVNNVVAPMNTDHTDTSSVYVNDIENSPQSHSYDNRSFHSHETSQNGYSNRTNGHIEHNLHV